MVISKNILIFLSVGLMMIASVSAANWYVDKDASGSNSGTSWTNAWESFGDIDWGNVQPGDTIYISGGTNSKVYYERLFIGNVQGTSANPITIKNSDDAGHNGRVIIDTSSLGIDGILIGNSGSYSTDYITIFGLEVIGGKFGIFIKNRARSIVLDSMSVYDWKTQGFHTAGTTHVPEAIDGVTIQNSSWISSPDFGGDAITFNAASNIVIRNNYIHIRNAQRHNAHIDGILAIESEGFIVYNNVIILDSNVQGQASIIRAWADSPSEDLVIIYNNFMYQGGVYDSDQWKWTSVLNLRFRSPDIEDYGVVRPTTYVLHNTIVANGPYVAALKPEVRPTFINNIVVNFGDGEGVNNAGGNNIWLWTMGNSAGTIFVDDVRNNLIWREWASNNPRPLFDGSPHVWVGNGNSLSKFGWSTWVNTLGGTGVNENPLFIIDYVPNEMTNQGGLNGELQANSPAINQGENIRLLVESLGLPWTDINGNPRDSTPNIGAYEFGGSVSFHPADLNQNGCVDIGEIVAYVDLWKDGLVTIQQVVAGVEAWQQGC